MRRRGWTWSWEGRGGGDRGGGGGGGQGVEEEVEGGANLASHGESEGVFQYFLILSRG